MSYTYTPLAKGDGKAFRYLVLHPGNDEDTIQITLRDASLVDKPIYTALSYTWGYPLYYPEGTTPPYGSERTCSIKCNGLSFQVTRNAYDALSHLRKRAPLQLWVDLICINQEDMVERAAQVKMMSAIYGSADAVLVWLGPRSDDYEAVAPVIAQIVAAGKRIWEQLALTMRPPDRRFEELYGFGAINNVSMWNAVARFFGRSWFSRAWVVQEVVCAQKLIVCCGDVEIHWNELEDAGLFIQASSWGIELLQSLYGSPKASDGRFQPAHLRIMAGLKYRMQRSDQARLDVEVLLNEAQSFSSTDERDTIYAFLGMTKYFEDGIIYPDYDATLQEVFTTTARAIIEQERSLTLLVNASGVGLERLPGLPSWVPDYGKQLMHSPTSHLKLMGRSPPKQMEHRVHNDAANRSILNVEGILWDVLEDTAEDQYEITQLRGFTKMVSIISRLDTIYHTGEQTVHVWWRTMIANIHGSARLCVPAPALVATSFTSFLLWYSNPAGRELEAFDEPNRVRLAETENALIALSAKSNGTVVPNKGMFDQHEHNWEQIKEERSDAQREHLESVRSFVRSLDSFYYQRRLFVTRNRWLGIAPKSCQPGDFIAILKGASCPFVVRKQVNGRYRLVGEAYIHGIMCGETIDMSDSVPIELE